MEEGHQALWSARYSTAQVLGAPLTDQSRQKVLPPCGRFLEQHHQNRGSELWCWRSLLRVPELQGDPTSPSKRRSVLGVHWKD